FLVGVVWATLRRLLQPSEKRGPTVVAALKYYAMSTMGLIGLRALAVDVDGTGAIVKRMRQFADAPHPALSITWAVAEAIHLHGLGRGAEVHRSIARAWKRLKGVRTAQVTQQERADLETGLLMLEGINESWRQGSRALECADQLQRIGTPLAIAASYRVSMTYYLSRGDRAQAQRFRRELEIKSIENGSLWQMQWFAVPIEGLSASTWHDLVGMRRALERFEQLVAEAPALAEMRDSIRLPYHFHRGDYSQAAAIGDNYILKHPPKTRIGWPISYAITALAHAHLGNAARALEVCMQGLARVEPDDLEYVIHYTPLQAAYATALALNGRRDEAEEFFRTRAERLCASGEHPRAVSLLNYRVRLARLLGDPAALQAALLDLRDTAARSRNPAAIALAHRLIEERQPISESVLAASENRNTDVHTLRDLLSEVHEPTEYARQALAVLCRYVATTEGYLYTDDVTGPKLTASLDPGLPPHDFAALLSAVAAANDTAAAIQLDSSFCAYRMRTGFAVVRASIREVRALPDTILAEIDDCLASGPHA
ncbi:MAG TPA: hypothetical protein VMF89_23650, partial [Polyangiales bacterium]|nr:hypothetical protein [Polyangiales bacterium]